MPRKPTAAPPPAPTPHAAEPQPSPDRRASAKPRIAQTKTSKRLKTQPVDTDDTAQARSAGATAIASTHGSGQNLAPAEQRATPRPSLAPSGLTREAVLTAALAQIDERGVEAFSVRDLARTLGVYPTALYWHVPSRNALISGAVAQALGELVPPNPKHPWQEELRALFARYRDALRRHPRIATVLGAQLVSNDSMNPLLVDGVLALLEAAGFSGFTLVNAYNVVIAAMVGFVTLELAPPPSDDPEGWAKSHALKVHSIEPAQAPTLARHLPALADKAFIVRWNSGIEKPLDAGFAAWCDVILDGLEVLRNKHR